MAHTHHDHGKHAEHSYKASVKKIAATSEIEIKSEISAAEFAETVKATLADLRVEAEIPGFRKGTAPEKLIRQKIGDANLLREAAEHAISHAYGHILEAEKIDAIGYPKVSITKIAEGNALEFTVVAAVVPDLSEAKGFDYKKIAVKENAKKAEPIEVSDADVEKALEDIKKNYPEYEKSPEFKGAADFKSKLRENLRAEKEHRAMEKKRIGLIDALTEALDERSGIVIPSVLVESELERMSEQMKHDVERMGLTFDDYLKHLKKTTEDLKKEWSSDALKRVKLDLILDHVAKTEKISADPAKVEAEVKHAREHHKDVDADRARSYFEHIFLNQAVFEFLEKQK